MSDRSGWFYETPVNTEKGKQLYELIGSIMADKYGPVGRASNITWDKMDGENPREHGLYPEKEAWEEIAQRFLHANGL